MDVVAVGHCVELQLMEGTLLTTEASTTDRKVGSLLIAIYM
jgi:hypothetical protein